MSLKKHVKVGAASGFLVFIIFWLTAIFLFSIGEPIFDFYDNFSPYAIVGWLSGLLFDPSQREGGILFVLVAWAVYTMILGMAISTMIFYFRTWRGHQTTNLRTKS